MYTVTVIPLDGNPKPEKSVGPIPWELNGIYLFAEYDAAEHFRTSLDSPDSYAVYSAVVDLRGAVHSEAEGGEIWLRD